MLFRCDEDYSGLWFVRSENIGWKWRPIMGFILRKISFSSIVISLSFISVHREEPDLLICGDTLEPYNPEQYFLSSTLFFNLEIPKICGTFLWCKLTPPKKIWNMGEGFQNYRSDQSVWETFVQSTCCYTKEIITALNKIKSHIKLWQRALKMLYS